MPDVTTFTQADKDRACEIWSRCYTFFKTTLREEDVKSWIDPLKPLGYNGENFSLMAPSEQFVMYLEDNFTREFTFVLDYFCNGNSTALMFEYPTNKPVQKPQPEVSERVAPGAKMERYISLLNESLSFDTFYESECNRIARTIGQTVADNPGQAPLNLLFIYGPSGVGKTHLVQAIGHRALEKHPDLRVCYVSSAQFEAQYVHDARFSDRANFISLYQQMDMLIIDDIQGLIGKTATQQAFFEIFNHLYLLNKQIVITSDVPPVNFGGMEERLITRIQSSLMMPLERPDLDLRRKILRQKVAASGVDLGEEVVEFIAEHTSKNVRELDGTVKTLLTYSQIQDKPIDLQFARAVMSQSIKMERREVTMDLIQQVVADQYGIEVSLLRSSTRKAEVVLPRQIVMYLSKKHANCSLSAIAERLGRKNHTTVIHGVKCISDRLREDEEFRQTIAQLEHVLLEVE